MGHGCPKCSAESIIGTSRLQGLVYGSMVTIFADRSGGIVGAGRIADFVRARGTLQANMLVGVFLALLWIPFHFLLFLAPTSRWAVLWLAPACIFAARTVRNRAGRGIQRR